MISFKIHHEHGKDFTPWQLIVKYCRENGIDFGVSKYFTGYVRQDGNYYTYHHYTIDGDTVEIFLGLWYRNENSEADKLRWNA